MLHGEGQNHEGTDVEVIFQRLLKQIVKQRGDRRIRLVVLDSQVWR